MELPEFVEDPGEAPIAPTVPIAPAPTPDAVPTPDPVEPGNTVEEEPTLDELLEILDEEVPLAATDSDTYGLSFLSRRTRERFLEMAKANSVIETGIEPLSTDRVLTLSTCSGGSYANRWVVRGRLKMLLQ